MIYNSILVVIRSVSKLATCDENIGHVSLFLVSLNFYICDFPGCTLQSNVSKTFVMSHGIVHHPHSYKAYDWPNGDCQTRTCGKVTTVTNFQPCRLDKDYIAGWLPKLRSAQ